MKTSQAAQLKALETNYEKEKEEAIQRIEQQANKEIKEPKNKTDKDEMLRYWDNYLSELFPISNEYLSRLINARKL